MDYSMLDSLASGVHKIESMPGLGRFSISIPERGDPAERAPLILALHWGVETYAFISHDFLAGFVQPAMCDSGAFIMAPDRGSDAWDDPGQQAILLQLLDLALGQLPLDPGQIVITGYSMGGIGSWHIAARRTHRFSALIPIACNPPADALEAAQEIPTYVIHGGQDELFPLSETRRAVALLKERGARLEFSVVEGGTHYAAHLYIDAVRKTVPWMRSIWRPQFGEPSASSRSGEG
jgi:predicted esterase